jgi:hypothetical protein
MNMAAPLKKGGASAPPDLQLIQGGRTDFALDMDEERREWRAELLRKLPMIRARSHFMWDWWRREFIDEFGRDPVQPILTLVGADQ